MRKILLSFFILASGISLADAAAPYRSPGCKEQDHKLRVLCRKIKTMLEGPVDELPEKVSELLVKKDEVNLQRVCWFFVQAIFSRNVGDADKRRFSLFLKTIFVCAARLGMLDMVAFLREDILHFIERDFAFSGHEPEWRVDLDGLIGEAFCAAFTNRRETVVEYLVSVR